MKKNMNCSICRTKINDQDSKKCIICHRHVCLDCLEGQGKHRICINCVDDLKSPEEKA